MSYNYPTPPNFQKYKDQFGEFLNNYGSEVQDYGQKIDDNSNEAKQANDNYSEWLKKEGENQPLNDAVNSIGRADVSTAGLRHAGWNMAPDISQPMNALNANINDQQKERNLNLQKSGDNYKRYGDWLNQSRTNAQGNLSAQQGLANMGVQTNQAMAGMDQNAFSDANGQTMHREQMDIHRQQIAAQQAMHQAQMAEQSKLREAQIALMKSKMSETSNPVNEGINDIGNKLKISDAQVVANPDMPQFMESLKILSGALDNQSPQETINNGLKFVSRGALDFGTMSPEKKHALEIIRQLSPALSLHPEIKDMITGIVSGNDTTKIKTDIDLLVNKLQAIGGRYTNSNNANGSDYLSFAQKYPTGTNLTPSSSIGEIGGRALKSAIEQMPNGVKPFIPGGTGLEQKTLSPTVDNTKTISDLMKKYKIEFSRNFTDIVDQLKQNKITKPEDIDNFIKSYETDDGAN